MNRFVAEFFGTFSLVFIGCGSAVVNEISGGSLGTLGIALCFGLVVTAMIYAVGDVSGAHLNPAVTIGFATAGRFPWSQTFSYFVAQFLGATVAAWVLRLTFAETDVGQVFQLFESGAEAVSNTAAISLPASLGLTLPAGSWEQTFVLEVVLTWLLMVVILRVAIAGKETGILAGVAIGSVIAMEAAMGGPISGASMNPARSFGPAVVSGNLSHLWVYFVAPILGAVLAVPVDWAISRKPNSEAESSTSQTS